MEIRNKVKQYIIIGLYPAAGIVLLFIGKYLLMDDYLPFLQWWLAVFCLGLIFLPLSGLLFSSLADRGYLFSKTIGIAVSGYLMWMLSSLRLVKFTTASCILTVILCTGFNLAIALVHLYRKRHGSGDGIMREGLLTAHLPSDGLRILMKEELLFFAVFLLFTYIRGFKPEAYGTEKFMDYGFMTTMMRSEYMPPQDFWFSGTKLNYYYVGQFLATYLTRLSYVKVSQGYNLMLMMTGAFAFMLPFSLGYNLFMGPKVAGSKKYKVLSGLCGLGAGLGVCITGNMHYPIYRWILPTIKRIFGVANASYYYWFPNATRYIGYQPDTNDKTIHEFPCYSFVLGDLHAHVINILFVLTVLAVLLAWLYGRRDRENNSVLKEIFHPSILMIGFFIGLFHTTNFWDFPIYYIVSGAVILFSNMVVYNFKKKVYLLTALQGILVLALSEIAALPFTLHFDQISAEVFLTENQTPLYQLLVLWGLPIAMVMAFLIFRSTDFVEIKSNNTRKSMNKKRKVKFKLSAFMQELPPSDLFILTIGLCAIGLVLLPEIVYVKDIYTGDYKRANTMFKLTYQAFILFGICFVYILIRLLKFGRTFRQKILAAVSLILFFSSVFYAGNAVKAWYGNIFHREGYEGIDAAGFTRRDGDFTDDAPAIDWLNEHVTGTPVILEANGNSYTQYQRVSVLTGLPTVLGWYTHERLWKSGPGITDEMVTSMLNERAADIETIYTSEDENLVSELIYRYDISYIYVGKWEMEKYEAVNHEMLRRLGTIVFENTQENNYKAYIIQVNLKQ